MRVRRALLFMPGDSRAKIEKGAALGVDAVIMDLEDGVALSNKPAARATIAASRNGSRLLVAVMTTCEREMASAKSLDISMMCPRSTLDLAIDSAATRLRATRKMRLEGFHS